MMPRSNIHSSLSNRKKSNMAAFDGGCKRFELENISGNSKKVLKVPQKTPQKVIS